MFICIYIYMNMYMYTYIHISLYIYRYIVLYAYIDIYIYKYIFAYTYVYTYIYTYRYIYTYISIYCAYTTLCVVAPACARDLIIPSADGTWRPPPQPPERPAPHNQTVMEERHMQSVSRRRDIYPNMSETYALICLLKERHIP